MKKAILTIVSGDKYEKIWQRTEAFFVSYAEKCDAELLVLKGAEYVPSPHWLKFSLYELLKKEFSRIAFIDADIIIRDDTPSLFDIVPENEFGIFDEGEWTPRALCLYETMKVYDVQLPSWNGRQYFNTGVMVVSKQHRHIFKVTEEIKPLRNSFGEQTYLNLRIMQSSVKIHNMDYKFNRMSIMDRITGMTRLDSYLIHYAGDGDRIFEKMDRDIARWKEDSPNYNYKRQVFVWALGGLGDMIAAEPTIRHIREKVYADADIYIMSHHPYLYDHIEGLNISKDYPKGEFDAVFEIQTHPTPGDKFGEYVPFNFTHCADWASMAALGRMLTDKDKEYRLTYNEKALDEVLSACNNPEELVLVHPGVGWETKTFPVEWWQSVIDGISELGFKVGIIGKNENEAHAYLPVVCPKNGVDLRDKLSVKGLIALISKARILVSNDSAPIHIAGAFDNYIVLIPTCKHPDHILPMRKGSKYYKATASYKKLIEDDDYRKATDLKGWQAKYFAEGHSIEEYIPDVQDVINSVNKFNEQCEKSYCLNKKQEVTKNVERFNENRTSCRCNIVESNKRGFRYAVCGEVVHSA